MNKIKFRFLAFGVTMSILPFLLLGYFQIKTSNADLQRAIQKHNMLVAQRTAEEAGRLMDSMTVILKAVVRLKEPGVLEETWEGNQKLLLSVLKMSPYFEEASILDMNFREIARASRHEVISPGDLRGKMELDIQKLLKEGIYISPVYLKSDGGPIVEMVAAFKSPAGDFILGGLRVQVSLRSVMDKITSLHIGRGAYIFMVDVQGRLIGHEDFSQVLKNRNVTGSASVRDFTAGVDSESLPVPNRYISYTGQEVLGVFAPVQGAGWGIIIEQAVDQAFDPIRLLIVKFLLATAVVIIIVTSISIFFALRFTQPIEVLERGVKRVGGGDLNYIIPVEREDEIGQLVITFNQMTRELKKKTDGLNFEKERLNTIVNGIGVGLVIVDINCRVQWSNPQVFKWNLIENTGECLYRAINHLDQPCAGCPVTGSDLLPGYGEEILTWAVISGRKRTFRHRVYRLEHAGENPLFLEIIEDITEEREIEEAMIQTDKLAAVGLLASSVAHEINNPLNTVAAYAGYMQEKLRINGLCAMCQSGELSQYLEIIQKHISRCATTTRNLLNFSRHTVDRVEEINITDLMEDTLVLLKYQLQKKEIRTVKSYSENIPLVKADFSNLQQAFLNLITNAVDALGQNGTLSVSVSASDSLVEVIICDNGHGISEKHISHIFEPFFTTKPVGQGTGLGLSISYGLITKVRGQIQVESREGAGTTVTVRLPAAATAKGEQAGDGQQ
ncbi:MAG: ATP-binding protein [Bacillota bacterium]